MRTFLSLHWMAKMAVLGGATATGAVVAGGPGPDMTSLTLDAWVAPEQLPGGGARLINKSKAGTAEGYLFDTFPGNSLRMIIKAGTAGCAANLPPAAWSHVAAVFDATTGEQTLYINGKLVQKSIHPVMERLPEGLAVTRGYHPALPRLAARMECPVQTARPARHHGTGRIS